MEDKNKTILELERAIASLQTAMLEELKTASTDKNIVKANPGMSDMVNSSPGDISARYWLMEFLKPLNRKEIESIANGFLVQLLNEEQAKKLVKFLLVRFPQYYKDIEGKPEDNAPSSDNGEDEITITEEKQVTME